MASLNYQPRRSKVRTAFRASLTTGGLLAVAVTAHAQTYSTTVVAPVTTTYDQFAVTTTATSPTFYRPTVPTANGNAGTTFVPTTAQTTYLTSYGTSTFTPIVTQSYNINTTFSGYDEGNFAQFIYSPSFNAASPLTNATLGFDNYGATSSEGYSTTLTAGTAYTFVNTGYFSASMTGAGYSSNGTSNTVISTYNPGSTTNIPDNSTTGASQSIVVTNTNAITSFNSITIDGLTHPFVGDLVATLTHTGTNGTTSVDLFDHVGADNNPADPGYNYGLGSGAAFNGNYTFSLTGASLAVFADGTTVPTGTVYKASGNAATGFDTANAANTLNSFLGQTEAGTWTLSIKDEQLDDTGSFTGFSFTVNAAPEPSQYAAFAVGLLGLGGMALRARRRNAS